MKIVALMAGFKTIWWWFVAYFLGHPGLTVVKHYIITLRQSPKTLRKSSIQPFWRIIPANIQALWNHFPTGLGSRSKIKFYHTLIFTPPLEIVLIVNAIYKGEGTYMHMQIMNALFIRHNTKIFLFIRVICNFWPQLWIREPADTPDLAFLSFC